MTYIHVQCTVCVMATCTSTVHTGQVLVLLVHVAITHTVHIHECMYVMSCISISISIRTQTQVWYTPGYQGIVYLGAT